MQNVRRDWDKTARKAQRVQFNNQITVQDYDSDSSANACFH